MPLILPIRKQGFPGLLDDLGIVQPLQGPFWDFSATIAPTVIISNQASNQTSGQPYFPNDFHNVTVTDPGVNQILVTTNQLPSGRYGIEILFTWDVKAVNGSEISLLVVDSGGAILRSYAFELVGAAGSTRDLGSAHQFFVEDFNTDDKIDIVSGNAMILGSQLRTTIKWIRLHALTFKDQ